MRNVLCCVHPVHFLADKFVLKPCERNGPVDVPLALMLGKARGACCSRTDQTPRCHYILVPVQLQRKLH